ncbi:MAG: YihY/virulence factor BrkB family protein [Solirubrobacterales bacterium]|nr:YihY/virulence factor BrkB family protein [Solirubrobacterales bacterium]
MTTGVLQRLDRAQRDRASLAVAVATVKKFSDDQSSNLAAMIAFWAFFSVFPLFLVLVTLLAIFLPTGEKNSVLGHIAQMFPLLDPKTVSGLSGAWWTIVLGLATALWSGSGVVRTAQFAFNTVWGSAPDQQPGLVQQVKRSILVLATVGSGLVLTTFVSGLLASSTSGVNLGALGRVGGYVLSAALNVGIFVAAFRILTDRHVTTHDVLPGALLSGIAFFVLQVLSTLIISRYLKNAQSSYGHFATVITILWWFYLQALITMLGAQLNVVLKQHDYPRSLT